MNNYIYTIAIDEYDSSSFPNLNNAKLDAQRFSKVLIEKYNYELLNEPITDKTATRKNIIEGLNSITTLVNEEDTLIIYFAGHGEKHSITNKGFWIPSDASISISDYIPNSTVIDIIEGIKVKHLLLVSDSCFSGTFLTQTRSGTNKPNFEKIKNLNSRWILTSGREEKVSDGQAGVGSPFSRAICELLESNNVPIISGDLFNHVIKYTSENSKQQSIAAHIENCGHKGGMIVFEPNTVKPKKENEISKLTIDLKLAQNLKDNGITQTSIFSYFENNGESYIDVSSKKGKKLCSAFLAQELHDIIPEMIEIDTDTYIAHMTGYDRLTKKDVEEYHYAEVTVQKTMVTKTPYMAICRCAGRMVAFSLTKDGKYNNLISWGKNQAEALAGMVLELKKEGKIK